jgi:hypothetical protein
MAIQSIERPLRWAINIVRDLPSFTSSGKVVLIGDAVSRGILQAYTRGPNSTLPLRRAGARDEPAPGLRSRSRGRGISHRRLPRRVRVTHTPPQDGYVLARLLAHPRASLAALGTVLEVYDGVRRPAAQRVAAVSRMQGILYELRAPQFMGRDVDDPETLGDICEALERDWQWAWTTSVEDEVAGALEALDGRLGGPN